MDATGLIDLEAFVPDDRPQARRANGDREASRAMRREASAGFVFAERTRKKDNPYHGDIVYTAACDKRRTKMIANAFALESKFVPPLTAPPSK